MVAIIPAAGLGTRMAALTGGEPKELLPLGRQSVLERVIDEAVRAGADETVVVSSARKPGIEKAINEWSQGRFREAKVRVVNQSTPRGLADALMSAPDIEDEVLILLGDCVFEGSSPAERMATLLYRGGDGCVAVETVSDDEVSRYGICEIDEMGAIRRIVEKPRPEDIASRWAVAARYAFSSPLFSRLREWFDEASRDCPESEITLTALVQTAIENGFDIKAVALQPDQARVDCGTPEEYAAARRLAWD
jgi:dTDP-glucose pyrophosphorylase